MDTMSLAVLTGCIVLFILWVAIPPDDRTNSDLDENDNQE